MVSWFMEPHSLSQGIPCEQPDHCRELQHKCHKFPHCNTETCQTLTTAQCRMCGPGEIAVQKLVVVDSFSNG